MMYKKLKFSRNQIDGRQINHFISGSEFSALVLCLHFLSENELHRFRERIVETKPRKQHRKQKLKANYTIRFPWQVTN